MGGIVGLTYESDFNYCYNLGRVTCTNNISGGIAGYLRNTNTNLRFFNCYNGTNSSGGGIIGNLYKGKAENCYYLKGTASTGIYNQDSTEESTVYEIEELPTVLSVINGDNAFTTDSEGNIVLKFN